jgi:hypothetical protein
MKQDGIIDVEFVPEWEAKRSYTGQIHVHPKGAVLHAIFKGERRRLEVSAERGQQAQAELDARLAA